MCSHSADFMDEVCTNMIDITLQKKLVYYGGNYTTYVRTKSENEVNQMKAYAKQQEEIAHIKSESRATQKKLWAPALTLFRVHCERRYLRQLGQAGQIEAEDYRQDGGCRSG